VSSFGAESVVLLHMVSVVDRTTPVLFLDTEMLFPETLDYQREVAAKLGLTNVQVVQPDREAVFARDPNGLLHQSNPDACCSLRKSQPLAAALAPYEAWVTGRKRYQGGTRVALEFFEADTDGRVKINPLAHWSQADVQEYIANNRLPRHPLVARGYPSIGCAPEQCTTRVAEGEDPRAGRWRGLGKDECGIHFMDGKVVRGPAPAPAPEADGPVIVTDRGFAADDWAFGFATPETLTDGAAVAVDLASNADPAVLRDKLDGIDLIRVDFPSFSDGRGFTIARRLRLMGFNGRLRAKGHVIADQYAMARRSGFDEVEIGADLARRQPVEAWQARADWRAHDYQSRLRA